MSAEPPGSASTASRSSRVVLAVVVLAVSLGLDLWTKAWAWGRLREQPAIVLEQQLFELEFAFNTGSAFGFLAETAWARPFFIVVTAFALLYLARMALTLPLRFGSGFVALGFIAGGALGNLHDRLFRIIETKEWIAHLPYSELVGRASAVAEALARGENFIQVDRHGVVDFIVVYYWPHKRWPAFNVADISLCIGVGLFLIYLRRHGDSLAPGSSSAPNDLGEDQGELQG